MIHASRPHARTLALSLAVAITALFAAASTASALTAPQLAPNYKQVCVLMDTGTVRCAGLDSDGQLGNGPGDSSGTTFVGAAGITNAVQVATNDYSNCARLADGTVSCWGDDSEELMGNGLGESDQFAPVPVPGLTGVASLIGADTTFCALKIDTTVWCWGKNDQEQTGVPAVANVASPTQVAGLSGVQAIGAGGNISCALMSGGTVKCWGDDSEGGLGNGLPLANSSTPVDVSGLSGAQQLAVGWDATCVLMPGGSVKCWGKGDEGQLGIGDFADRDTPIDVPGLTGVQRLIAGYEAFCALMPGGTLKCWGYNGYHDLGLGADTANKGAPVDVPGISGATIVPDVFDESMCVGYPGGAVKCWGYNANGQTGISSAGADVVSPTDVPGLDLVTQAHPGLTPSVRSTAKPKTDRRKRTYKVSGSLTTGLSSWVSSTEACTDNATVSVKYTYKTKRRGKTIKRKKTVKTSPALTVNPAGGCLASFTLKLPVKYLNGKTVTIKGSFVGNGALQAFEASLKKKLPKVKVKKK